MLEVLFALAVLSPFSSYLSISLFPIFTCFSPGTMPRLPYPHGGWEIQELFHSSGLLSVGGNDTCPAASLHVPQVTNPPASLPVPPGLGEMRSQRLGEKSLPLP